jgi:type IV secretory pathway VirB2 component (pilin)
MKKASNSLFENLRAAVLVRRGVFLTILSVTTGAMAWAQADPWSNAATRMGTVFSSTVAKGFALVAVVVGGLELAFSEGGGRRVVGSIVFGLGMALGAANLINWLFS